MIRLPEPYSAEGDGVVGEIVDCCVASFKRSPDKRAQLEKCRESVTAVSAAYRKGVPGDIEAVMALAGKTVGCDVVAYAYKKKLVDKNAPGRKYYEHILSEGLRHGRLRCPVCGVGWPSELDHYLPKSSFPVLAVTPANLVPICSECNKATNKGSYSPRNAAEALFHPYFEDPPDCIWLRAETDFACGPCVTFGVEHLGDGALQTRLGCLMNVYGLDHRYGSVAVGELDSHRELFRDLLFQGGLGLFSEQLETLLRSAECSNLNCWQAALWRAVLRQIDEAAQWAAA